MSFRRYEVILPTRYNDGTPVEHDKYWATAEEIISEFGAVTWQPEYRRRFEQEATEVTENQGDRFGKRIRNVHLDGASEIERKYPQILPPLFALFSPVESQSSLLL